MHVKALAVGCAVLAFAGILQTMSGQDKAVYSTITTRKMIDLPGLPKCSVASVESGDPSKGESVIFAKAQPGCTVPWHWHTPTEQLLMVSGRVRVEMKNGAPANLHTGDFLALPPKHVHRFLCVTGCTLFIVSDSAFDIHYVDGSGKEIPPDEALKAKAAKAETK